MNFSPSTAEITIRMAYAEDEFTLIRLAALDSASAVPPAPRLLAEVDGEPRAVLSLRDGTAIADPFTPTAELLELLHRRSAHLRPVTPRRRSRAWWAPSRRRAPVLRSSAP